MVPYTIDDITIDFFNGDQLKIRREVTPFDNMVNILKEYLTEDVEWVSAIDLGIGNNHYTHDLGIPLTPR